MIPIACLTFGGKKKKERKEKKSNRKIMNPYSFATATATSPRMFWFDGRTVRSRIRENA